MYKVDFANSSPSFIILWKVLSPSFIVLGEDTLSIFGAPRVVMGYIGEAYLPPR